MDPLPRDQVGYGLRLLDDLVHEHSDAWWISDIGDNDIIRFFLMSPERDCAIELLMACAECTSDEDARREAIERRAALR